MTSKTEISDEGLTHLLKADHFQHVEALEDLEVATSFSEGVLLKTSRYGRWRIGVIGGLSVVGGVSAAFQINHLLAGLENSSALANASQVSPVAAVGLMSVVFIIGMAAWSQPSRH